MKDEFGGLIEAYGLNEKEAAAIIDSYDWEWGSFDKADIIAELESKRAKTKPISAQMIEQEGLLLFGKKSPFNVHETIVGRIVYFGKRLNGLSVVEAFDESVQKIEEENLKRCMSWAFNKQQLNPHQAKKTAKSLKVMKQATAVCLFAGIIATMTYAAAKQQGKYTQEPALKDVIHQQVSPQIIQKGSVPNHAKMNENER